MSAMKTLCLYTVAAALVIAPRAFARAGSPAAESTWTGQISDSACGAKHEEAAEGQGKMPDRDCTQACVRGGSKYVLVVREERDGSSRATVLQIANQDNKDLTTHAGHTVRVTGELKGGAITISKIVMP